MVDHLSRPRLREVVGSWERVDSIIGQQSDGVESPECLFGGYA